MLLSKLPNCKDCKSLEDQLKNWVAEMSAVACLYQSMPSAPVETNQQLQFWTVNNTDEIHQMSRQKLWLEVEPLYTLLSESSLVDFVSISHTAKRLPPKIRICLVCYQKEIWSKQHGSNWGLQESQIRHSFSQVSEIFQISVDLASFQLLEKLKKVCPWHVQACPSGNFPTFI